MTAAQAAKIEAQLKKLGPLVNFPWHLQQEVVLRAATDVIVALGGNRSGKSQVALGAAARLVRREGPIYQRLRNPKRPLKIWVAPQNLEKFRSVWETRLIRDCFDGMDFHYTRAPFPVITWQDEFGGGELWGKSQTQGFMAFESDEVDLCIFDEEPEDKQVVSSARTRFATTNGVLLLAFTPLMGMTFTWDEIVQPAMKDEFKIGDRAWRVGNEVTVVQMGMADNPASVAGGGVARIQADTSMHPAEKAARLYGTYGFTEGLLLPQFATLQASEEDNIYLLDELPKDKAYAWLLTLDPNKRHGGLLTAHDHEGNHYCVAEHYHENLADSEHAALYRTMLAEQKLREEDVEVFADPGGAGAQSILNLAEVGFYARAVPKDQGSVSASIKRLRRAAAIDKGHRHPVTGKLGAPHIYFLRSLNSQWKSGNVEYDESRLMWELRQYRQKPDSPPDTPVKKNDDLVDPLRYQELVRMAEPELKVTDPVRIARERLDNTSRHEAESFDKLIATLERKGFITRK